MRMLLGIGVLVVACGIGSLSVGQSQDNNSFIFGGWRNSARDNYPFGWSSTAAEGYGRGLGSALSGLGRYNLATSEAALNMTEVRRNQIANDRLWTETYFYKQQLNRENRAAQYERDRGNPADYPKYSRLGVPKRLTNEQLDAVTGEIRWPMLLTLPGYAVQRTAIERVFADRAYHGAIGPEDFMLVRQLTSEMIEDLRDHVAMLPPQQYLTAKRFLQSLAYQAGQPVG
ncbi:MAG: hypothetical protein ABFC63_08000 [Thermoguttaceae bacterium]